jgi:hypothetical protein
MLSVTIDQVLAWDPCYSLEQIEDLFGGREQITALDVLAMDIPATDRIWAVLHPGLIDEMAMHGLACDFAGRALLSERKAGREPDQRSWDAIEVKRRWLAGEATDAELAAAMAAARAAARAAATDAELAAAMAAARAAARAAAAARDAAWEAARAAAMAAARAAAARDAAWAAAAVVMDERGWQLARIREVLEKDAR